MYARGIAAKYLAGADKIAIPEAALQSVQTLLASDTIPPRDLFAPVSSLVLSQLQVNALLALQAAV